MIDRFASAYAPSSKGAGREAVRREQRASGEAPRKEQSAAARGALFCMAGAL